MMSRIFVVSGIAVGLALAACSGQDSGSLDDGSQQFTKGDDSAPATSASSSAQKSTTPAPTKSTTPSTPADAGAPKADGGTKGGGGDACAQLATCCEKLTKQLPKLICTTAAGSNNDKICEEALKACEGGN